MVFTSKGNMLLYDGIIGPDPYGVIIPLSALLYEQVQ